MIHVSNNMNPISIKIGFWSTLFLAIMEISYAIGLGAIFFFFTTPTWTDIYTYSDFIKTTSGKLLTLCQIAAFAAGPLFILLLCSLHDYVQPEKKILTRIGICFGVVFAVLASMSYFVQITVIPQNLNSGQLNGLEQFVEINTKSYIAAMVVLGYSLFFGLVSLFIAPIFCKGRLGKVIRYCFITCGVSSILEIIGFYNLMLGMAFVAIANVSLIIASILLCIFFQGLTSISTSEQIRRTTIT
ncbi:MAG: hypothetical protein Q8880_11640 [Bacteroidota bacterium]|nr:hypothetical protein [Bacteroidota bacterium]